MIVLLPPVQAGETTHTTKDWALSPKQDLNCIVLYLREDQVFKTLVYH